MMFKYNNDHTRDSIMIKNPVIMKYSALLTKNILEKNIWPEPNKAFRPIIHFSENTEIEERVKLWQGNTHTNPEFGTICKSSSMISSLSKYH